MAQRSYQLSVDTIQGSKKFYYFTGTTVAYPIDGGLGGYLHRVIVNKGITGTITLIDQASANSATKLLNDQASSTSETIIYAGSFAAQPAYPRRLSILPGGTTGDVAACSITVYGTDWEDVEISEAFAFLANASTATNGTKRFKTVRKIVIPAQDGAGATWDVGERAGDTIGIMTNPTVDTVRDYEIGLAEGLSIEASAATDVTISYLE